MGKRRDDAYQQAGQDQPGENSNCSPGEPLCLLRRDQPLKARLDQISEDVPSVQGTGRKTIEEACIKVDPTYPEKEVRYPEEPLTQRLRPSGRLVDRSQPAAESRKPLLGERPGIPEKGRPSM